MTKTYTVVGLNPDTESSNGMREASFVEHIEAMTPTHAGFVCRGIIAVNNPDMAGDVEILAVFHGAHKDDYEPGVEGDEEYMARLDSEMAAESGVP